MASLARRPSSAFVSYARQDGEDFARALRERLAAEHPDIHLWQDRAELRGGVGWWQQIELALEQVSCLVIVMTPAALVSQMTRKEWRFARQQGVDVVPVKGVPDTQIDWQGLPSWMRDVHFHDLEREWTPFVLHLKSPPVVHRVPFMAPDLRADLVARPREFDTLIERLIDRAAQQSRAGTLAVQGGGGFGKTTLACKVCHDDDVITFFPDGVLWVTLGETPDLRRELTRLHRALTGAGREFLDVEEAALALSERLADAACLIVIDDVWKRAHLEPFRRGGPRCMRLVTTRRLDLAAGLGEPLRIGEMSTDEAAGVLVASLPAGTAADPQACRELARQLGEWPLLLRLAGSAMQSRIARGEGVAKALQFVETALKKRGVTAFDRSDAESRSDAIARTIGVSLDLLSADDRGRCFDLAVFPEDTVVPISALAALWQMDGFDAEECARRLADLALIELDLGRASASLHDVLRQFYAQQLPEPALVHARLVDGWGDPLVLTEMFALDGYCRHLAAANREDRLRALMLDPSWLEWRLARSGVQALLGDFRNALPDDALVLIEQALRQASHLLAAGTPLRPQLLARLLHRAELPIVDFCSTLRERRPDAGIGVMPVVASLRDSRALQRTLMGHRAPVCALAVLGSTALASAAWDASVHIWEPRSGESQASLRGNKGAVFAVVALPDGRVAAGGANRMLRVWQPPHARPIHGWPAHQGAVRALLALADGRLASSGDDDVVRLWDASGAASLELQGDAGPVLALAALPGERLASAATDGSVTVWSLVDGTVLRRWNAGDSQPATALAALHDGRLACGSGAGRITIWNVADDSCQTLVEGHGGCVYALLALHDRRLASAGKDRMVRVWNVESGRQELECAGHGDWIRALAQLPSGELASASDDRTVKLWRLGLPGDEEPVAHHSNWVGAILLLPSRRFATASTDHSIGLWDLAARDCLTRFTFHKHRVNALAEAPSGRLASASSDGSVRISDPATGQVLQELLGHKGGVLALAQLRDGRLASGGDDRMIRLWSLANGTDQELRGHGGAVGALLALPDGRLVSGAKDCTIRVWSARGEQVGLLRGHTSWVLALVRLADGRIASASRDRTVRIWDLARGSCDAVLEAQGDWVRALVALPGERLGAGVDDGTIVIWSTTPQGWQATPVFRADTGVKALTFVADEDLLLAGDAAGRVHFLRIEIAAP